MAPDCPIAGPLQLRILVHLWRVGTATVHEIHDALSEQDHPRLAYTTILTVARNLAQRGLAEQRSQEGQRAHVFAARVSCDEYRRLAADWFVREQFQGDGQAAQNHVMAAATRRKQRVA